MRDYKLFIPEDCTASIKPAENESALLQMKEVLKADIRPSSEIEFTVQAETARAHAMLT